MRSKWWLILLAFTVVAGSFQIALSAAGPSPLKPPRSPVVPRPVEKAEDNIVDGYGANAAAAREMALKHATERVETLLRNYFREQSWTPPPEQLSSDYLIDCGVVLPLGDPQQVPGVGMVARYKVELTRKYKTEVERVKWEQRVRDRNLILARVLAGLVVLLLVMAGYLRLEDMTRGYATQMLRVVAFGLVALTSLVLWLTM